MAVADPARSPVRKYRAGRDIRVIAAAATTTNNMPVPHRTGPSGRHSQDEGPWDMAGQAQRGSRGHGRSSRPGSSSPPVAAASVAAPGAAPTRSIATPPDADPTPMTPPPATRPLYRLLQMKGLSPAEAANLTAFMCGLPADRPRLVARAGQPAAVPPRDEPDRAFRPGRREGEAPELIKRSSTGPQGAPPPALSVAPTEAAPSLLPAPLRCVRAEVADARVMATRAEIIGGA